MDEGCRIFLRFKWKSITGLFSANKLIVSCKFFMIKNSNYLTIKLGLSLSSMLVFTISYALPPEKIPSGNILFSLHAKYTPKKITSYRRLSAKMNELPRVTMSYHELPAKQKKS